MSHEIDRNLGYEGSTFGRFSKTLIEHARTQIETQEEQTGKFSDEALDKMWMAGKWLKRNARRRALYQTATNVGLVAAGIALTPVTGGWSIWMSYLGIVNGERAIESSWALSREGGRLKKRSRNLKRALARRF